MKKRLLALVLAMAVLFSFAACGKTSSDISVNTKKIIKQDMGSAMPKILFSHEKNIVFWGSFGLFVLNGDDGSVYRSVDLQKLGYNHLTGELATRFLISEDYNTIYFYNEGEDENNIDDFYYTYQIEEDKLEKVEAGTQVQVLPPFPNFSMEIAGGEYGGYSSNPVYYDENTVVFLNASDWNVKDLTLCKYNVKEKTTEEIRVFEK